MAQQKTVLLRVISSAIAAVAGAVAGLGVAWLWKRAGAPEWADRANAYQLFASFGAVAGILTFRLGVLMRSMVRDFRNKE